MPSAPPRRAARRTWCRRLATRCSGSDLAGSAVLGLATLVAVVWANSPWRRGYAELWSSGTRPGVGALVLPMSLHHLVNDMLMAVFFLVVGAEIKHELVAGRLRDRRAAALPVVAAVGGMVTPALFYVLINRGGPGASGWGIPMATDIAFALGLVTLLRRWVPVELTVFLLALAIVDDIGAITVIAVFYSDQVALSWLLVAGAALLAANVVVRCPAAVVWQHRTARAVVLAAVVVGLWWATDRSGVHATIAGVALGLSLPSGGGTARRVEALRPWTALVIVPVFAFANVGVQLGFDDLRQPGRVGLGVIVGLVLGKAVGITVFAFVAVRCGLARLPVGVRWAQLAGVAAIAGVGFTVALFVSELAFDDPALVDQAKVATLIASLVAAVVGAVTVIATGRTRSRQARRRSEP